MMDVQQTVINPNKALWEKGDFTKLAETMRESGAALVAGLGNIKGLRVLDLGCGDGTTAIPEAIAGAKVLGVDIARNLVAAGNRRAKEAALDNIHFQEGDACKLVDLADNSFDLVVSIFGAMFAPKPEDVAREMLRVTKPGGRIVMGNWIPGDPTLVAQILKTSAAYTPAPPAGFVSPMLWGIEEKVTERFTNAGATAANISFEKGTFTFKASYSPAAFLHIFKTYYGPTMNAFEAAEKNNQAEALEQELKALFDRENRSGDPGTTLIPATYLRVTVIK